MNTKRCTQRNRVQRKAYRKQKGVILVLFAIMLALLIGIIGLAVDGGLIMAYHERAQNIADVTARSVAIALHNGADHAALQQTGKDYAFTYNNLPDDPELSESEQLIINHPPVVSEYFRGNPNYVEVIVSHHMNTNFIQVLGVNNLQRVTARAVAGFRQMPREAGLVILDPRGNPGLSVSGTNAKLLVDAAIVVYTNREGENEFGATVGEYHAGQPSVTLDGSGATMEATELNVTGGVDDHENYVSPAIGVLHAGTDNRVNDPFHDVGSPLPVPTRYNGVDDAEHGSVSVTAGSNSGIPTDWVDPTTGDVTLQPGIYNDISISGGVVNFAPGIYVLQQLSGGGNILSITGGTVTGNGVMFYNTGNTWNAEDGGDDQFDIYVNGTPGGTVVSSETEPSGLGGTKFGGIDVHGENVTLHPIEGGVFDDIVIYQRRFNETPINITDGQPYPKGIFGRFYAKWAKLKLSGQGTYNFSIVVGSMSVSGNAIVTVKDIIPPQPMIEPIRLVE